MAQTVTAQGTEHLDKLTKDASHAEHQLPTRSPEPRFGLAQWKDNLRAFKTNKKITLWCVMIISLLINFGFDAIISGQALAFQAFREDYGRYYAPADDYVISAIWQSLWAAANTIRVVIGSFFAGFTNDWLGRKFSFWINLVISVATSFFMVFAPNVQALFGAKLVFGISIGFSYTTAPLYVVENAYTEIRSTLISFFNVLVIFGQFLGVVIANPLSKIHGSWSYKGTFCLTFLIPAILLPLMPFLPESPMWYMMKERRGRPQGNRPPPR